MARMVEVVQVGTARLMLAESWVQVVIALMVGLQWVQAVK